MTPRQIERTVKNALIHLVRGFFGQIYISSVDFDLRAMSLTLMMQPKCSRLPFSSSLLSSIHCNLQLVSLKLLRMILLDDAKGERRDKKVLLARCYAATLTTLSTVMSFGFVRRLWKWRWLRRRECEALLARCDLIRRQDLIIDCETRLVLRSAVIQFVCFSRERFSARASSLAKA